MHLDLTRRERVLIALAAILAAAGLALMAVDMRAALGGWLAASVTFSAVSAGATYLLLTMRLIPGAWGEELRLAAEAGTLLTPFALLAFVPVMLGAGIIYPWATGAGLNDFQAAWLGEIAYALRTLLRFLALIWVSRRMRQRRSTVATAAGGLLVLPLLASLTAADWLMSLDPEFASSGFGLQFLNREVLVAFAAILLLRLGAGRPPARLGVAGGVLLTLLLIWAYLQYMPFLTAWSGNLPSSAEWYISRGVHGWGLLTSAWAGAGLLAILLLLFPDCRARAGWLRPIAALVLASQLLESAWLVLPAFQPLAVLTCMLGLAAGTAFCVAMLPAAMRHRIRARIPRWAPT